MTLRSLFIEMSNHININIHQHTPSSLVYYEIQVGKWSCDGDALDVPSALKLIQHHLKWDYRDYQNEIENDD